MEAVVDFFEYRNGELFAEGVPVRRIAQEVGTPTYVYSLHATPASLEGLLSEPSSRREKTR